jgi:hypothetical protein
MRNLPHDIEEGVRRLPSLENIFSKPNNDTTPALLGNKKQHDAVVALLQRITHDRNKINDMIFIMSAAYDEIYKKYNIISLCVLVLSSVVTLTEAIRLSMMEYVNKNEIEDANVSFIMNILTLSFGTIITILSSIIRFRNYRELLEQLKDNLTLLVSYRDKYSKKYYLVLQWTVMDSISNEELKILDEKIQKYDDDIKSINVIQFMRICDVIKFNKYKAFFDVELQKINMKKNIQIQKIIEKSQNHLQKTPHPSPLSAVNGSFTPLSVKESEKD